MSPLPAPTPLSHDPALDWPTEHLAFYATQAARLLDALDAPSPSPTVDRPLSAAPISPSLAASEPALATAEQVAHSLHLRLARLAAPAATAADPAALARALTRLPDLAAAPDETRRTVEWLLRRTLASAIERLDADGAHARSRLAAAHHRAEKRSGTLGSLRAAAATATARARVARHRFRHGHATILAIHGASLASFAAVGLIAPAAPVLLLLAPLVAGPAITLALVVRDYRRMGALTEQARTLREPLRDPFYCEALRELDAEIPDPDLTPLPAPTTDGP